MRFLILGASGRTGQVTVNAALQHGHTVTALVRNPSTAGLEANNDLRVVQGNPRDLASVQEAFSRDPIDAVIITLGVPRESDSPFAKPTAEPFFIRDCVENILTSMKKHGTKRVAVMSAFGAKDSMAQMAFPLRMLMKYSNMAHVYRDHDAVDDLLRESGVEWSAVRPAMLNDQKTGKAVREFGENGKGVEMFDSIERGSVAEFMVQEVERKEARNGAIVIIN